MWLVVLCAPAGHSLAGTPHHVLVIFSHGRLLPGNLDAERGLSDVFATRPDLAVSSSYEILDSARFGGPEYERVVVPYLRDKYALQPPDVVIVSNNQALEFILRHRHDLFTQVPIVHMGVGSDYLDSAPPLPPDVVGTPIVHDFLGTVAQARRWHPEARRLIVVTGTSPRDRQWEAKLRAEAARLPPGLEVAFLNGLPADALRSRLREIPADSIVYTPGFFRDGNDRQFEPREAAELVAAAANAPVYGPLASFVGAGAVGGRAVSYESVGRIAAETAIPLLEGRSPSSLRPPAAVPTPLEVDWRELQRWGIPDSEIPADAIVRFREPTLWEAYRKQVLVGALVMVLQAGLIVALLLERRRRRLSEEHLRLAANAADLSVWALDGDDIQSSSPGRAPDRKARAGTAVTDFRDTLARMPPQDRAAVATALQEARDARCEFAAEYRVEAPEGGWRWQSARGRADHSQPQRLLGVAIDVTQRKRAELQAEQDRAALHHMTRVSLLGQLSASIAHQLNQPLASILGNAEAATKMLRRDPVDVPELLEICQDIIAADRSAADAIRRLGALFKRGEPLFEPLDLGDLALDTIKLTRSMLAIRQIAVVTELADALPTVSGDRVQLQQLLLNLVVNAADAMSELPEERRVVKISTGSTRDAVRLCVHDRGPGVPPEAIDKLFEPFWTTRPAGMGMGLAVSRSIAEAHRGSLTVANAAEGGAVFCLELPRSAPGDQNQP